MMRPTMVLIVLLAASLSLTLFVVKYQVQDMEDQLTGLNRSITSDKQAIHVLKAEWSYLNDPDRLKALAKRYLGFGAIDSRQFGSVEELLPEMQQTQASPISTTRSSLRLSPVLTIGQEANQTAVPLVMPVSVKRPAQ